MLTSVAVELGERQGDLTELEEYGASPSTIGRLIVLRTFLLSLNGVVVGAGFGVGLGWLAVGTLSTSADARSPVPTLALAIPWPFLVLILSTILAITVASTLILTRRRSDVNERGDRS